MRRRPDITKTDQDDCVSRKPWGEVRSRSLKLFTFNAAGEGGKSIGRVVFYVTLAIIALTVATLVVDALTCRFSSVFDFWPFNRAEEVAEPEPRRWW